MSRTHLRNFGLVTCIITAMTSTVYAFRVGSRHQRLQLFRRPANAFRADTSGPGATGVMKMVLGDYSGTREASDQPPSDGQPLMGHSDFDIIDMLLQRSIQTLCRYCDDTDCEFKADWLSGFLNHTHLDGGSNWHSILGMRVHFNEYLRELMREPVRNITFEKYVNVASLGEPVNYQPRLYQQTVQPRKAAESIMLLSLHLSAEFREDLKTLASLDSKEAREEVEVRDKRRERIARIARRNKLSSKGKVSACKGSSLDHLGCSEGSSPLRRQNIELLQRASTLLALKSLQTELAQGAMSQSRQARELIWLDDFAKDWWDEIAGISRVESTDNGDAIIEPVSDALFDALQHRPPVIMVGTLIDPPALAQKLYEHRERAALQLTNQLNETESRITNLKRECLERVIHLELTLEISNN